jgi:hypothetical protein
LVLSKVELLIEAFARYSLARARAASRHQRAEWAAIAQCKLNCDGAGGLMRSATGLSDID